MLNIKLMLIFYLKICLKRLAPGGVEIVFTLPYFAIVKIIDRTGHCNVIRGHLVEE